MRYLAAHRRLRPHHRIYVCVEHMRRVDIAVIMAVATHNDEIAIGKERGGVALPRRRRVAHVMHCLPRVSISAAQVDRPQVVDVPRREAVRVICLIIGHPSRASKHKHRGAVDEGRRVPLARRWHRLLSVHRHPRPVHCVQVEREQIALVPEALHVATAACVESPATIDEHAWPAVGRRALVCDGADDGRVAGQRLYRPARNGDLLPHASSDIVLES
mmetsp:Transcript_49424/g.128931  ORF Transcript_49424/g.128931 Transcript_49424/m.128931 type:complete len:217 (+) Transcript_49424:453-1103(+)